MRVIAICAGFLIVSLLAVFVFKAPSTSVETEAVAQAPVEAGHEKAHAVYGKASTPTQVSPEHAKERAHAAANVKTHAGQEATPTEEPQAATKHENKHHWSYSGATGPANWGHLDPKYAACGNGRNQSPVDLDEFVEAVLQPLEIDYHGKATEVINNGHAIQANFPTGDGIGVDGDRYSLKQIHFHSPSENTLQGRSFPLEAHFVHVDEHGNLAVVAVLFEQGSENTALRDIWSVMPAQAGGKASPEQAIVAADLLPNDRDYYRFSGSLTTPPCSEGVTWLVMKQPLKMSDEQIQAFTTLMGVPTNRPVQPLNSRVVLQ